VTITWHETTLGNGASVPTVKTEANGWGEPDWEVVLLPQLESVRTAKSTKSTPVIFEFCIATLLI
jgi:hypothetical protein